MNPERWHRIDELFRTVANRPPAERDAHLTQVCGDDEELRGEVLDLLSHEAADGFLQDPIKHATLAVTAEAPDELLGRRIGPYRLTRLIGRGGMGAVYEALRDDRQFDQRVALKLIKRGMDSDFVRTRFLRERQILAALDHPHIARLFDGGTTAGGLPYFVMEFVAGEPITEYCRRRELSLEAKLKLFRDVCAAVQHAHQKLVVHRDLKPNNILVTASSGGKGGTPKLLDFGIAKLLTPDADEHPRTETSVRLMTPEYASPEQVRGGAITTATDVYTLGVVLYELLAGRRPYQFETYTPPEIERAICDTEAARPSEAAGPSLKLGRQLSGDLDNIVMMALRKEPARRYPSVEQFSEDIRRYLDDLPVTARADTFGYRLDKFIRRHKTGVAVLALLVLLAVTTGVQAVRIARERDRANQQAATAQAVTQSLVEMFAVADPSQTRGNVITAKELLDQGAERVVRELKDQPVVQAKLLDTIGQLYQSIGLYDREQPLLEEALRLRRQALGAEHPEVAASLNHLGDLMKLRGDFAKGETLYRAALGMRRKLLGPAHADVAESLGNVGMMLIFRGNFGEAEPMLREALQLRRKRFGEEHPAVADSLTTLARLRRGAGQYQEAAALYRQSLTILRKLYGAEHPEVASTLHTLGITLHEQGDLKGAEAFFREALSLRRKLLGEEHPDVAVSLAGLASVLQDQKNYDEAERLYRQALALLRKPLGAENPWVALGMNELATLLRDKGDYAEAGTLFREALAMQHKLLGDAYPEVGANLHELALLSYLEGKYAEAEQMERQAIDTYQKFYQPEHWRIQRSRSHLGACLSKLKRYREAEEPLLAGYAGLKAALGEPHAETQKAVSRLIELYEAWGKPEQASFYRALPHASSDKAKK